MIAGLGYLGPVGGTPWPEVIQKVISAHHVYHGTPDGNVAWINMSGLKESVNGMLGKGLYATHDFDKARCFAEKHGGSGKIFKCTFNSSSVKVTEAKGDGWRTEGYDAVYSTAAKRPEMCIDSSRTGPPKIEEATNSMFEFLRAKLDEFFLNNPSIAQGCVYFMGVSQVLAAALQGATWGASLSHLFCLAVFGNKNLDPSEVLEMVEKAVKKGTVFGAVAGVSAGAVAYSSAAVATTTAPAAGMWGWLGYTATVPAYTSSQAFAMAVGTAARVAFPAAGVAAFALYAAWHWNRRQAAARHDSSDGASSPP